jgi:hypothetical protein
MAETNTPADVPPGFVRVLSVEGHRVPMRDDAGRIHMERFVGYAPDGTRLSDPVLVPDTAAVWEAFATGALAAYTPPAPPQAQTGAPMPAGENREGAKVEPATDTKRARKPAAPGGEG